MANHTRRVGFMAGSDPTIALVIVIRMQRPEVRGEKNSGGNRIAEKGLQRGFDLRLASVRPYRSRQEIIELGGENRRVEMRVEVESRLLRHHQLGRKQMVEPMLDSAASRLDTVIAAGIEETGQPIGGAQATTADIENLRFRAKAFIEQRDELPAPRILESLDRDAQEPVPSHHV